MPTSLNKKMFDYDLIFLCNGSESLKVSTSVMVALLKKSNVYIVADGYVTNDHSMNHKIVWHPTDPMNCNDYWSRPFYPQLYNNYANANTPKVKTICAINGTNRPHRDYFFNLLSTQVPEIELKNTYSTVGKPQQSMIESKEDTIFRIFLNELYKNKSATQHSNAPTSKTSLLFMEAVLKIYNHPIGSTLL
jgi:hypothetical protein